MTLAVFHSVQDDGILEKNENGKQYMF